MFFFSSDSGSVWQTSCQTSESVGNFPARVYPLALGQHCGCWIEIPSGEKNANLNIDPIGFCPREECFEYEWLSDLWLLFVTLSVWIRHTKRVTKLSHVYRLSIDVPLVDSKMKSCLLLWQSIAVQVWWLYCMLFKYCDFCNIGIQSTFESL